MKLNKDLEQKLLKLYNAYWDSYLAGDIETMGSLMDHNISVIGSTEGEIFFSKKDVMKFYTDTAAHIAGTTQMRNRKITIEAADKLIFYIEQLEIYILIDGQWTFYSKARISSFLRKNDDGWKFIHQHGSLPDTRASEGEQIAFEKISKENLALRDAVKRRTVELENKNRELKMETSLERVRVVAMGMKQPTNMLDVCRIISQQLTLLNLKEIRNVQTAIFYELKGIYLNYEYFPLHDKSTITSVEYNLQPDVKAFVNQMLTDPEAFFTSEFTGARLNDWIEYQKKANQFVDPHLSEITSLHYYFYSIGPGALGISTYAPLHEDDLAVFKRIRMKKIPYSCVLERYSNKCIRVSLTCKKQKNRPGKRR